MKEIKFRAWDKIQKKWVYDILIENGGNIGQVFCHSSEGYGGIMAVKNYPNKENISLMQYTNLKDKNGKEIYEEDTLKQSPGFGCEWDDRIGIVTYSGASFWFDMGGQAFVLDDHDCDFEVIGNIYENPELININKEK